MKPPVSARVRLFCFAYAGGAATVFRGWQDGLGPRIALRAVELPGRGRRWREAPIGDLVRLAELLADELAPQLDLPFAFFGHSLGTLVAFELAHALRRRGLPLPGWLLLAARRAPQFTDPALRGRHLLPDEAFKQMLREMGGTPAEVLESDEMMRRLMPMLRADFSLSGTYFPPSRAPLPSALLLFGGRGDRVYEEHLLGWCEHTTTYLGCEWIDGGHFFVNTHAAELQARIRALLLAPEA